MKDLTAAINMVVKTFAGMAGLIFLLLVIAQFVAFFSFTNIATVLAANLADFLETVPLGATSYIIIFVLVIFLLDLILTGAVAKWAIFAPVFIPLFMRLGGDPNLVLAAYRVGDSPANVITPLNVYLGGDGRLRRQVPEGRRHRHHRLADAALHGGAAGALDAAADRLARGSASRSGRPDSKKPGGNDVRSRQGARHHRRRSRRRARAAVRDAAAEVDLDRSRPMPAETRACAEWHAADLAAIGFDAARARHRRPPDGGRPPARRRAARRCSSTATTTCSRSIRSSSGRTIPFDPKIVTRADGSKMLVGRGTADDKGQLMTFVEACRAWKKVTGHAAAAGDGAARGRGGVGRRRTCRRSSTPTSRSCAPTTR